MFLCIMTELSLLRALSRKQNSYDRYKILAKKIIDVDLSWILRSDNLVLIKIVYKSETIK